VSRFEIRSHGEFGYEWVTIEESLPPAKLHSSIFKPSMNQVRRQAPQVFKLENLDIWTSNEKLKAARSPKMRSDSARQLFSSLL